LVAALAVPIVGLALVETLLRLLGYGYLTDFLVHHRATGPGVLVENQRFAWRFAPPTLARNPEPILVKSTKAPGACRILVFGESAAIGDPAPAFGFSRLLEVLLRERYPGTRFEVINTAFTAINSHVIRAVARDARALQGDVWLVYMGNNEVIGPYGAGTVFGQQTPSLPLIHASLALKTTRIGQALDALQQRIRRSSEAAQGWGGMSMFMSQQVRRDDPRLTVLGEHFAQNLDDIITAGTGVGAQVVVSTMVSRLRDWPPFGSQHRLGLTEVQRGEWERAYQAGMVAEAAGDFATAARDYEAAARIDGTYAELQFRWGTCALVSGQGAEAQSRLALARDLDTLRFRTDSRLNEAIRQTVARRAGPGVRLLDAERAFARSSTNGLPGGEFLHEHVHFTFAGNYLLARLFADEVAALLPANGVSNTNSAAGWLSSEACAARLGYTDCQQFEIAKVIRRRFDEPIYRQQPGQAERLKRFDQELAELRGVAKPQARRRALEACRQAAAATPGDWMLQELIARLLVGLDDFPGAEAAWREVSRLLPHAARPQSEIGKAQQQQGQTNEALASFTKALELNPDWVDAHVGLAGLYRARGERAKVLHHSRLALSLDPTRTEPAEALKAASEKP
jgi:tetratricopeptide (TPR) repeat protein